MPTANDQPPETPDAEGIAEAASMSNQVDQLTEAKAAEATAKQAAPMTADRIASTSETVISTPFKEWWDSAFKLPMDIKNYWADSRAILADPTVLREGRIRLRTKPFGFAFNGVLLPSLVIGLLYAGINALYDLPKPQIEREIEYQKKLQDIFDDGIVKITALSLEPTWTRSMSTEQIKNERDSLMVQLEKSSGKKRSTPKDKVERERIRLRVVELSGAAVNRAMTDLQVSLVRAKKETAQNRLVLLTLNKFASIINSWRSLIIGLSLILNAYLFGRWIRKLSPSLAFSSCVTDAHLYILGTTLFLPGIAAALLETAGDLSVRYDLNWLILANFYLSGALGVWVLVALVRSGRLLQYVLDGAPEKRALGRVTWRLLGSQFTIGALIQIAMTIVGVPLLWFVSKFQK
jgi:hypothetical protein